MSCGKVFQLSAWLSCKKSQKSSLMIVKLHKCIRAALVTYLEIQLFTKISSRACLLLQYDFRGHSQVETCTLRSKIGSYLRFIPFI